MGESTDDLVDGFSKYREEIKGLSGVDIMKNENEYKDIYDIFVELASVWDDMKSDEARARVAEILGGTRQLSGIMSTITNIKDAIGAYSAAMDSAGVSMEANNIVMETTEAHLQQMKATFQELSQTFMNTDVFKFFIDGFTGVLSMLNSMTKTLGSLGTITVFGVITKEILKIRGLLKEKNIVGFKAKAIAGVRLLGEDLKGLASRVMNFGSTFKTAYTGAIADGMGKTEALSTALTSVTSKFGLATVAITAAGIALAAWKMHQNHVKEQVDSAKQASEAWSDTSESLETNKEKVIELRGALESGVLTDEEAYKAKSDLLSIQQSLVDTYGDEVEGIDLVNGSLKEQIALFDELSRTKADQFLNEESEGIKKAEKEMEKTRHTDLAVYQKQSSTSEDPGMAKLKSIINSLQSKYGDAFSFTEKGMDVTVAFDGDATLAKEALNEFMTEVRSASDELGGNDFLDTVAGSASAGLSDAKAALEEYEELYNKAKVAELFSDKNLYSDASGNKKDAATWMHEYTQAIEEYNQALASGDPDKINEAKVSFDAVDSSVKSLLSNDMSSYSSVFGDIESKLNKSAIAANEFKKSIETDDKLKDSVDALKSMGLDDKDFIANYGSGAAKGNAEIKKLTQTAIELGVISDDSGASLQHLANILVDLGVVAGDPNSKLGEVRQTISELTTKTDTFINSLSGVLNTIQGQKSGQSISLAEFNSESMKKYRGALENVNGVMQINAEKAREIAEAQAEQEVASIEAQKALDQQTYMENARQIAEYRAQLETATGASKKSAEENIDALLSQNSALAETCNQYDLLSSSIMEAVGSYQHWLNAQSAGDYGDMANDAIGAMKNIFDTFSEGSEIYGNYGSKKFSAAIDFIVPDSVDQEDLDAVEAYMKDFSKYLKFDDKGAIDSLNIDKFLEDSVNAGLMSYSEDNGFEILGNKKMEDFAKGLSMSSGVVQAFFDELQLKGGKFNWADESVKTIGDLGIMANEAAEELRKLDEYKDLDIKINTWGIEDTDEKIAVLDNTIKEMDGIIADVGIDSTDGERASSIIQYCIAQKQILCQPDVMKVDTSQVEGALGDALALLQEFQSALDNKETLKKLNMDTSDAQAQIDEILGRIKNDPGIVTLGIDPSSEATVQQAIDSLTTDKLIELGVDDSAILNYDPGEKKVVYKEDTSGLPESFDPITRYVKYKDKGVASLPKYFSTITRYVNYVATGATVGGSATPHGRGSQNLNGTAHAIGTAAAGGDWGTAHGGKTLVGELGREIVVDPHSGRWYTVGDNGAEFANIPAGSIVFNHLQTEDLLAHGYVSGRASALVSGTAMMVGGYKERQTSSSSGSYSNSSSSGTHSVASSSSTQKKNNQNNSDKNSDEKEPSSFDYIEIAIDRIERAIKNLDRIAKSAFRSLAEKLSCTDAELVNIYRNIEAQNEGYQRYLDKANSVGLSGDLAQKVQDGSIDIQEYDEETSKLIEDYKKWYEKAIDCADAVDELHEKVSELYQDKFNDIASDFEKQLSLLEHLTNSYDASMDNIEKRGYIASTRFYESMQKIERQNISVYKEELESLTSAMSDAMVNGDIAEGSEAWYDMQIQINEVSEAIQEAENNIVDFANSIREIEWGHFDYLQDQIKAITDESQFMIDLMSNSKLHDKKGQLTDTGMATMGMHGQNYNVLMNQADRYAEEVKKLDSELANDPNNTILLERRAELIQLQRESILAAEDEKKAIVDMVEEGIQLELDSLQELIDKYNEAMDSSKDLYDYQKNIKKQTEEIAKLQKQLSAYAGDNSEETKTVIQKIEVELGEALENLEETQYERYISDQKKLLDSLYLEYETLLNERLDNIDALVDEMIANINANAGTIGETITTEADNVGYTLSESMRGMWTDGGAANVVIAKYGDAFLEKMTVVNSVINGIAVNVARMVQEADAKAKAEAEKAKPSTPAKKPSTPATPPSKPSNPTPPKKAITVGGLINAGSAYIYSSAGSSKGLTQYYKNDPIYRVLDEKNGYLLVRHHNLSSGYTGWFRKSDVKAYKKGGLVDYTGLAWVDGQKGKPESFLNAEDTDNITKLRDALRAMNEGQISLDSVFGDNVNKSKVLESLDGKLGNIDTTFGDFYCNISIPIEHVSDYNDFVNQLRADNKFEKLIQSMTIDRLAGGSRFDKNKYIW